MIGVKGGTKTWSDAPQRADFKTDGAQNVSALDKAKHFQDEDLGEILNKVSDPNYVDTSKKMRTVGKQELDKDAFMSLLLTQMKNQDPTNPLKSHEMAAQLAQFTSLEKLQNINAGVDGLRKDMQPNQNFQALTFIGKTVMTDNSKVSRISTDDRHDIRFSIPSDVQKLKMEVKNAEGAVVRTVEFKGFKAGKNEVNWNGMTEEGTQAPPGDYTISLEGVGSNGRGIYVETKTEGVISGVNFTPRGPQLMIGKQVVNMSDIKSISEPTLTEPVMQNLTPQAQGAQTQPSSQSPKKGEVKAETKPNAEKAAKLKNGNLNDAAMAQGLINTLNKTGAKAGMG